jgi:hypothetical protein
MDPPSIRNTEVNVVYDIGRCRPGGACSLVEAVDLVSRTIAHCRTAGIDRLLFDGTGLTGLPIPTLVERFLMVEDWATESSNRVAVALVIQDEYIHPQKFGVKLAERFGLVCNVFTAQDDALRWLADTGPAAA